MKNWYIYIPEEGDWPIDGYSGDSKSEAKAAYLRWAGRKTIPKGARIWSADAGQIFGPLVEESNGNAI